MKHAVFTIVQDEPFFFPLWYKYYRGHYEPSQIHVLYHPLPEEGGEMPAWLRGTLDDCANVVRVEHEEVFDHRWLREQVELFAATLLQTNDTVAFAEADEFIALDPDRLPGMTLPRWADEWCRYDWPAARCAGYEVIHRYDEEPPYDPSGPALRDRRWWYGCGLYSKTLIWRRPPAWSDGFHNAYVPDASGRRGVALYSEPPDPGLMLIHLHRFDYGVAAARLARTAARFTGRARGGHQNRLQGEGQLRAWWYSSIDLAPLGKPPYEPAPLVEIPEGIRNIHI